MNEQSGIKAKKKVIFEINNLLAISVIKPNSKNITDSKLEPVL